MDEDKYIKLLLTSCKVIRRKMGNILIVIKPHPRENTELINKILKGENILNTYISREHVVVLAKSARLAISFWGSAILDGLSLGVPSIEFYEEANRFREAEPKGSSYKNVGIDSTDNERGLAEFIDSVLKHDYKTPKIINEFYDIKDVSFVNNIGE
jgi:spore coat polysaccharide biosynthesis predicted glycosyltransferase SpsG